MTNKLARFLIGTIFLVGERARHSHVCSIENSDIYIIVRTYVTFAKFEIAARTLYLRVGFD